MQILTTHCPYCHNEVDCTTEQLDGPVICPSCNKPFEMEMPTAVVTSVHEVDEQTTDTDRMAVIPEERTLMRVHPVVFRSRPIASLVVIVIGVAALSLMVMSLAGMSIAGYPLGETMTLGPASLLTWLCALTLLVIACVIGYWMLLSQSTKLTIMNDRTIYQEGIIARETSEVQHDDVRNIQLDQSFMQRLLRVGGIGISSSGQDGMEVVAKSLPNPGQIIDCIRKNQT